MPTCRPPWPTAFRRWRTARGATPWTPGSWPRRWEAVPIACRSLLGHLARAGVISPSPAPPDRVVGRLSERGFDRRAAALCRTSVDEGAKARWRQYREIWAYVELDSCRRRAILRHFGDHAEPAEPPAGLSCCDACAPVAGLVPELPPPAPELIENLDGAILSVARAARPAVGRTTCVEILHGARTKKIERNSYDGLPAYGSSSNMRRADILARVDQLIEAGVVKTSGGPYPVLQVSASAGRAAA